MKRLACSVVTAALFTACNHNASTPTAPAPNAGVVVAVNVGTAPAASVTSKTFQLLATARYADGAMRDVTSDAKWESSNPTLATVSVGGLVTVMGAGDVELRATYQNVTGSMHVLVSQPPTHAVALAGTVREVPPSQRTITGVRMDIVTGADAGKFGVTDAEGVYRFEGLSAGRLSLTATAAGYQSWAIGNLLLSADTLQLQDVFLYPTPPKDANGAWPTARCNDGSWTWVADPKTGCDAHSGVAYTLDGSGKPTSR